MSTAVPIIHLPMPACPKCLSTDLRCEASREQWDGTRMRYMRCRRCEQRFRVVLEPPEENFTDNLDSSA